MKVKNLWWCALVIASLFSFYPTAPIPAQDDSADSQTEEEKKTDEDKDKAETDKAEK